jgi:hypothetical protein
MELQFLNVMMEKGRGQKKKKIDGKRKNKLKIS